MFLIEPTPTRYDLHFQVFGFPVRVHPLFWLGCLITGAAGADGAQIVMWTFVSFVSILVHELGHALMMRHFGISARVVLYLMGGLATEGRGSAFDVGYRPRQRTPNTQILISLAGPCAGFIFAAVIALIVVATGGKFEFVGEFPFFWRFDLSEPLHPNGDNWLLYGFVSSLFYVNILWGLVNLVPVYPLDGGQIAHQIFLTKDPWGGLLKSLWLSVFTCAAVVAYAATQSNTFMLMMFLSLAASNYMAIQQLQGGGLGRGGRW